MTAFLNIYIGSAWERMPDGNGLYGSGFICQLYIGIIVI